MIRTRRNNRRGSALVLSLIVVMQDLTDAQEQASWFVVVEHWAAHELLSTYEGPLEQWAPAPGTRKSLFTASTPPHEGAGDWSISLRYEDKFGNPKSYDGSVDGLGLPLKMIWLSECTVTGPGD